MKRIQRLAQRSAEFVGRGEKTEKLTSKLTEIEKKVEGIRNGCLVICKKLPSTFVGSGSTLDKHQKKIPQYAFGHSMMDAGSALGGNQSLFGSVLAMVGQAQIDIAGEMSQYEISVTHDIVQDLNTMLEEDWKKVDKAKKKLSNARLDMDAAKTKLRNQETLMEKTTREYNMEKIINLRLEEDESTRLFDDAQDAYATEMYEFLSKEQLYTTKVQELVMLQITHYKNAAVQLEGMLPTFEKKMKASQLRPVFGAPLDNHLSNLKQDIATVLDVCCTALREHGMDTEGLFRIAAGSSKVKFLKSAFDAGQTDVSAHDSHAIAGCLKMYLRELPEPLLTYDLYSEWIKGAGIGDYDKRTQAIWALKEQLPATNLSNLRYLMAFLYEFSLYSEITKMTVNNIAIVIGPNLLWPREESADPLGMVTDTAMQRRLTEILIEKCHWMFPGLPEPQLPSLTGKQFTSPSNSFSSSHSLPPVSPRLASDSISITSTGSSDTGSGGSPAPIPTARPRDKPSEIELPHPLADHAQLEGINVHIMDNQTSPTEATPSPKTRRGPPPVAPYKPVAPHTPGEPQSPLPKPRLGSMKRTLNREAPPENGSVTPDTSHNSLGRPTPASRPKRVLVEPPPPATTTPTKPSQASGRGPSRRAPPPPVSKKPHPSHQDDEISSL